MLDISIGAFIIPKRFEKALVMFFDVKDFRIANIVSCAIT